MPGFYRKKRRKAGPNKNQEKVQRGRAALTRKINSTTDH